MTAILVNNIGKKYKRYAKRWHRLAEWLSDDFIYHQSQWVLRGISFTVEKGESVGVIGQNGAGKSTLLKILTGTTFASEGDYQIDGRVSSLLELGMGFHPDFTGRQNVYLTGQIMGFHNDEIESLMPDIEDFAEIGDYIDQPLRTYSSGMVVRLAFASVTAARPDILLVDEALSVGDVYFQHKCFSRIRRFREAGTTLLFVSHDPGAVKNLCDRAVLLDRGLLVKDGSPEEVLDYYNAVIACKEADYQIKQTSGIGTRKVTRSGNGLARIASAHVACNGEPVNAVQVGECVEVVVEVDVYKEIDNPTIGIKFKDRLGNDIYGTNTYHLNEKFGCCNPGETIQAVFKLPLNLGVGNYSLTVAVHKGSTHLEDNYDWWDQAATIQIVPGSEPIFAGTSFIPGVSVKTAKRVHTEQNVGG